MVDNSPEDMDNQEVGNTGIVDQVVNEAIETAKFEAGMAAITMLTGGTASPITGALGAARAAKSIGKIGKIIRSPQAKKALGDVTKRVTENYEEISSIARKFGAKAFSKDRLSKLRESALSGIKSGYEKTTSIGEKLFRTGEKAVGTIGTAAVGALGAGKTLFGNIYKTAKNVISPVKNVGKSITSVVGKKTLLGVGGAGLLYGGKKAIDAVSGLFKSEDENKQDEQPTEIADNINVEDIGIKPIPDTKDYSSNLTLPDNVSTNKQTISEGNRAKQLSSDSDLSEVSDILYKIYVTVSESKSILKDISSNIISLVQIGKKNEIGKSQESAVQEATSNIVSAESSDRKRQRVKSTGSKTTSNLIKAGTFLGILGAGALGSKSASAGELGASSILGGETGDTFGTGKGSSYSPFIMDKQFGVEKGNAQIAVKLLMDKGWSKEQAAGIVGNLMAESSLNIKAFNASENAFGIAQWRKERQDLYKNVTGKDIHNASFEEQIAFVDWELKNSEKAAGDRLKSAKTGTESSHIVERYYERDLLSSMGKFQPEREQRAEMLSNLKDEDINKAIESSGVDKTAKPRSVVELQKETSKSISATPVGLSDVKTPRLTLDDISKIPVKVPDNKVILNSQYGELADKINTSVNTKQSTPAQQNPQPAQIKQDNQKGFVPPVRDDSSDLMRAMKGILHGQGF